MGTVKRTLTIVSMLVFMLGGAIGGGYLFVSFAGPAFPLAAAADYVLAIILFCLLMLSGFVGICLGVLAFLLVLRPFTSKEVLHETLVSDTKHSYPRTTQLLESLLDVIY